MTLAECDALFLIEVRRPRQIFADPSFQINDVRTKFHWNQIWRICCCFHFLISNTVCSRYDFEA